MKKLPALVGLSLLLSTGKGQERAVIVTIPSAQTSSALNIANHIQKHYDSDHERLLAIYSWVILNIQYDDDSMYVINWNMGGEFKVTEALRRKKGVCENFAAVFSDIANKCGIRSFVVDGYTAQGRVSNAGHSWSAVKLNDQWLLCDPTWDKDSPDKLSYFLVAPSNLIATHMPFDPMWQLLDHPLTHSEFLQGRATKKETGHYFNYKDSIIAFTELSELQRLEAAGKRMENDEVKKELVRNRVAYNKMKVAIIYEEEDRKLYNAAVSSLNNAFTKFNEYAELRNNQFQTSKKQKEISDLLQDINFDISVARNKLRRIGTVVPNDQYNTTSIAARLDEFSMKVQQEKYFVEKYFATYGQSKKN